MSQDDRYQRFNLRIPKDLFAKLQAGADEKSRSMNAEIVHLLTEAKENDRLDKLKSGTPIMAPQKAVDELNKATMRLIETTSYAYLSMLKRHEDNLSPEERDMVNTTLDRLKSDLGIGSGS